MILPSKLLSKWSPKRTCFAPKWESLVTILLASSECTNSRSYLSRPSKSLREEGHKFPPWSSMSLPKTTICRSSPLMKKERTNSSTFGDLTKKEKLKKLSLPLTWLCHNSNSAVKRDLKWPSSTQLITNPRYTFIGRLQTTWLNLTPPKDLMNATVE